MRTAAVDKRPARPDERRLRPALSPSSSLLQSLVDRGDWAHVADEGDADGGDSVAESDAVSVALSAVSALDADDVVPIDSERYAKICGRIERLQRAVSRRDAKAREAKAKLREQRRCFQSMRAELVALRTHVDSLGSRVARESAAKAEAIERAAVVLLERERLLHENTELRRRERLAADQLKAQHAASAQVGDLLLKSSQEVRELQAQLIVVSKEKTDAETQCRGVRADLESQQRRLVEVEQRNAELSRVVEELKESEDRDNRQLQAQSVRLTETEKERRRLRDALDAEREESKRHAAHLLQSLIKAEDELARANALCRRREDASMELRESFNMMSEELQQSHLGAERARRAIASHREQLQAASRERCEVAKQCRELDESRRRMLAVFVPMRKHLSSIDAAMAKLCVELQRVSKAVAVGRHREAAIGQALREYGKRNRELQSGLDTARQKLRVVAGALRSSEKRKGVAVASSASLKRDLVLEQCQRSELLQQCRELAACLDRCQGVASESRATADALHAENDALQLAVQQLVAYAQALAQSQRSLQRELRHLEVAGLREPAVFG